MKRIRFSEIISANVDAVSNTVAINGKAGRADAQVFVDIDALSKIATTARRGQRSYRDRLSAGTLDSEPKGTWHEIAFSEFENLDVVPVEFEHTPSLALVFDKGTEQQLAFRLSAETARLLAEQILVQTSQDSAPALDRNTH